MRCRWQVEIDRDCQAVLAQHWPEVERYDDVTRVSGLPSVDVLVGGFPCQDVSVAGRRAGLAGKRSGLFWEVIRLADELRPTWMVIENVPGLLSSNGGRDMGAVLWALGELGYGYAYRVLDAQFFGLAQRRKRLFIVCNARAERAVEVLFEPESCGGDSPPRRQEGERVAPTFDVRAGRSGETTFATSGGLAVANTLKVNDKGHSGNAWNSTYVTERDLAHALCSRTAKGGDPTTDTYVTVAHTLRVGNGRLDDYNMQVSHTLRAAGCDASEDGTGRGTPLVVDTTQITSPGNYSQAQPGDDRHPPAAGAHPPLMVQPSVRRLTPTECSRLQGFPDDWTAGHSDSARYRMLGNAVAVPVVTWIGQRIIATHEAAS